MPRLQLACAACGWTPGSLETDPYPFRCPRAGTDDGDHILAVTRDFSPGAGRLAGETRVNSAIVEQGFSPASNPFLRYRTSLYSWHVAQARGGSDADRDYCSLVERVDAAVERVAGTGFRVTPLLRAEALDKALGFDPTGGIWIKDETRNVSGSHKARHVMGVALYLEVLRRLGFEGGTGRPLAVASCGNAALAAAVVARAIDRRLLVFVPDHAAPAVVLQLEHLGATVTRCSRSELGDSRRGTARRAPATPTGDPCYLAFRRAVADGALPFSCQGNENGLVIEGGATIGYEIVDQICAGRGAAIDVTPRSPIPDPDGTGASADVSNGPVLASVDRLFVQVGGGALASACIQAFVQSVRDGRLAAMPRIHAVQTCGGYPLKRAYDLVVEHVLEQLAIASPSSRRAFSSDAERAAYLRNTASEGLLDESFRYARRHRSTFMWPWEAEPQSIASGILDDETYDWAAVVEGMVRTGGFPIAVDEATLREANGLAGETTGVNVDHTGSSGLAGLMALTRTVDRPLTSERIVVLFTGARRS